MVPTLVTGRIVSQRAGPVARLLCLLLAGDTPEPAAIVDQIPQVVVGLDISVVRSLHKRLMDALEGARRLLDVRA